MMFVSPHRNVPFHLLKWHGRKGRDYRSGERDHSLVVVDDDGDPHIRREQ